MKKGCFLTIISILTVLVAVIIYIFKFHQDDIFDYVKPFVLGKSEKQVYSRIDKLNDKTNADSLKKVVIAYEKALKTANKINIDSVHNFFKRINQVLDDGKIDSTEITEVNLFLKNQNLTE